MQGVDTVLDPAVSDWETGREDSKLLADAKSYSSELDVFIRRMQSCWLVDVVANAL